MRCNLDDRDRDYYQRRERQERANADRTDHVAAKRLHAELAERYSTLLGNQAADTPER